MSVENGSERKRKKEKLRCDMQGAFRNNTDIIIMREICISIVTRITTTGICRTATYSQMQQFPSLQRQESRKT